MTFETFDKLFDSVVAELRTLRDSKGKEYANNDQDRLANFKEIAKELGVSPLAVISIYTKKHSRAIDSYCKRGQVFSNENIQSRIKDRIMYDLLLLGLVEDLKEEKTFTSHTKVTIHWDQTPHSFETSMNTHLCNKCANPSGHPIHLAIPPDVASH